MSKRLTYSDQITDYLFYEMDDRERMSFEARMKEDAALASEVETQREILEGIHSRLILKEVMEDPDYEETNKLAWEIIQNKESKVLRDFRSRKTKFMLRMVASAATVALLWIVHRATEKITPISGVYRNQRRKLFDSWKLFRTQFRKR